MGEIRREHEGFRANPFDGVGQSLLIAFAADEDAVVFEIVEGWRLSFSRRIPARVRAGR